MNIKASLRRGVPHTFRNRYKIQPSLPIGHYYFSVPIGKERVEFNAHRVFDPATIVKRFSGLNLVDFAVITHDGSLIEPTDWKDYGEKDYACGLFIFKE
jgi:hypothetical protein